MFRSPRLLVPFAAVALIAVTAPFARAQSSASEAPLAPSRALAPATAAEVAPAPTASSVVATPAAATRPALSPSDASAEALRDARAREAGQAVAAAGSRQNGKVYMIVGGAAFLAGAIIGKDAGTIIMVGGAGIGIYGLYLYLQ